MRARLRNNQSGMVLLVAIGVIMVIMIVSATIVLRAVSTNTANQRSRDSLEAYYEAEAGISYTYHEENLNGFKWYTHQDKDTQASTAPSVNIAGASIDTTTGCYKIAGRNFLVKTFPEYIGGTATGMTIILSQGIVNGIKRTIEYRVGTQGTSVYNYFFFYPGDLNLKQDGLTYDGRNYGGIHANGDVLFQSLYGTSSYNFNFLTELSCGSNVDGKGYFRAPVKWQYTPPNGDVDFNPSLGLSYYDIRDTALHFYGANIKFKSGPIDFPTTVTLPGYLDDDEYPGAAWNYDKYYGTTTTPRHYRIDNTDLRYVAAKQTSSYYSGPDVTNTMMSKELTVTIPGVFPSEATATEFDMFKKMNSGYYPASKWNDLWLQWKQNHADDYAALHTSGQLIETPIVDPYSGLTLNRDWERRFFYYHMDVNGVSSWHDYTSATDYTPNGIPDAINMEWWEDMEYGTDAAQELVPARMEDYYSGIRTNKYFLNTEFQTDAWTSWLAANNLNQSGTDKTLVQDKNTGGQYLDPSAFLETASNTLVFKQRALDGGIYIGLNEDGTNFLNPISDIAVPTQFYNAMNMARDADGKYKASSVLKIDVAALKAKIDAAKVRPAGERTATEQKLAAFNGVIYVDLAGYNWSGGDEHYDDNADAVMLYNGARLPDGGLSLGTPNNIMIKGDYNLDPIGIPSRNRDPDDTTVTTRYTVSNLEWQPAEVLTKRMVYTLSNDYPEPQYYPLHEVDIYEYSVGATGKSSQQYWDDSDFPTPDSGSTTASPYDDIDWMPTVAQTRTYSSDVDGFFLNNPSVPPPAEGYWSRAWIETNWLPNTQYTIGWRKKVKGSDLRGDVEGHISSTYSTGFTFSAVHGASGTENPETPSFTNRVTQKHIYNTVVMTPYNTQCYNLENWRDPETRDKTPKQINGAFIQLPDTEDYKLPVPAPLGYTSSLCYSPDFIDDPWIRGSVNTFVYESRFGLNANPEDLPRSNLTFGAANSYSSWRERKNADF